MTQKKVDESWKETVDKDKTVENEVSKGKKEEKNKTEPKQASKDYSGSFDFSMLLNSFGVQAMIHLGVIDNPVTRQKEENIEAAKEMIDILTILEEKTKGNLSQDEEKLFSALLYDLRMRFVEKQQST